MEYRLNRTRGLAPKVAGWTAVILAAISLHAQTATDLSQVKNVFVPAMSGGNGAAELHQSLVKQLRKSGKFEVVATAGQADAVIKASGQIWVKGYIATSPRTPAANRQAIYAGFLSVEVVGADNAVLWSYLVTPSKLSWGSISDNLAENLVREMVAAHEKQSPSPEPGVAADQPAWRRFDVCRASLSKVVRVFPAATSRMSASATTPWDRDWVLNFSWSIRWTSRHPMCLRRIKAHCRRRRAFRESPPYWVGWFRFTTWRDLTQDLKFTPEALAGIYLGKITKWNDPIDQGREQRCAICPTPGSW